MSKLISYKDLQNFIEGRLKRQKILESRIREDHHGRVDLTYYAGYDCGYIEGKIAAYENLLDEINVEHAE